MSKGKVVGKEKEYILEDKKSKVKLKVTKEIIYFLELHDIVTEDGIIYYKVNDIYYKLV